MRRSGSSQRLSPTRRDPSHSPVRRDPSPKRLSPASQRVKKLVLTTLGDGDGRNRASPPRRKIGDPPRRIEASGSYSARGSVGGGGGGGGGHGGSGGGGGSYSARGSSSGAHGGGGDGGDGDGGGSYSARGGSYRARVGRDEYDEPRRRHHLPKVATSWEDAGAYAHEAIKAAVLAASHAQRTARGAAAAADNAARSADEARQVAKKAAHLAIGLTGPNREQWLSALSPRLDQDPATLLAQRGGHVAKTTPHRLTFDDPSTTYFTAVS